MNKSILFVQPPCPTYTEIADELVNPNHDKFGIADGDETSPTVTNSVQRGKRKWNVYAGINLPLGILTQQRLIISSPRASFSGLRLL